MVPGRKAVLETGGNPAPQGHHFSCRPARRLKPDRIRALELLAAGCPQEGCTEAVMLAHGISVEQIVELVRAGLTAATVERIVDGGKAIEIARVRITEVGRRAIRVQLHSWRLAEESYGD
jgi:hypothetical protein